MTLPVFTAPPRPYHLELEASPGAVFPYLGRFGNVEIDVYGGGVRAEALWLNAISRNGATSVTVMNPLGRMYVDVGVNDINGILRKLAGTDGAIERAARPTLGPVLKGTVAGISATRQRLMFGNAWIDVWMTDVVPENTQYRAIADQLLRGISPATADIMRSIRGTPVYVELNFRRFQKVALLRLKRLSLDNEGEADALERGPVYVRATVIEKLWQ